jgi:alpha-2-macroglobulin
VQANGIGEAAVEVLAVTTSQYGEAADALGVAVPVRPPEGSLRVGAMHGRLVDADELSLPIDLPASALDGRGELVVTASTSLLHGIAEAVRMLGREPVPWPEVAAPRLLALAGGIGVVEALRPAGVSPPDELRDRMAADVDILLEAFRSGRTLDPFTSIQAAHALVLAQSAGAEVPAFDLRRIGRDLGEGISEPGDELPHPGAPEAARLAYALHVASGLDLPGDVAREVALRWTRSFALEDLPGEALAWLLRPLAGEEAEGEILRILDNRALRSTSGATLRQGEVTGAVWMASHRTTDAIVLAALLESGDHDDPRARDLVEELTRSLLAHRDGTTWWASAFESAWGVLALGLAFEREQAAVPADLVVTGHLGDEQVGHTHLGAEDASALEWRVPVDRPGELRIHTEGNGTLHLRVELRYTDPAQDAAPVDRGFSLVRSYEAVDEPDDVVREEDGSWRIRAGARVRVRLTLTTPVRRHLVELRDPLAGGFEAIDRRQGQGQARDPTGTLTARMPAPDPAETRGRLPWLIAPTTDWTELAFRARIQAGLPWHTHREVADGRVDAYAAFLPAGSFETTHLVRAAVPGSYHIAAPRVEEVSHPETSGAGMADRVLIEVRDGG